VALQVGVQGRRPRRAPEGARRQARRYESDRRRRQSVQRVVCGDCQDYKVVTKLDADKFGAWAEAKFAPEAEFLAEIEKLGVKRIDTQTYTLETL
jgi:hypothetical protein